MKSGNTNQEKITLKITVKKNYGKKITIMPHGC